MRDPMTFERRLADAYERWASEMPTEVDALALVGATRSLDPPRRATWPIRSLRVALVLALLVAALIAAALLVASLRSDDPPPSATVYEAVVARSSDDTIDIVAVRTDGHERLITSLPAPERDREVDLRLSRAGWLAVDDEGPWRFIDLRDPSRVVGPPELMPSTRGSSWTPDGRFAEWDESGSMRLFDPETGTTTMLSLTPPLYDIDSWTADGTGFVQGGDGPIYGQDGPPGEPWHVVFLDGRPDERAIPSLDPSLSAGKGSAGMRLQVCDPSFDGACPNLPNGAVVGEAADGTLTTWYRDELAPGAAVDASFADDGTAMWLVLDRRDAEGRRFVLARAAAGEVATEVMSAGLPSGDAGTWWPIMGVAPDESLVVIGGMGPLVLAEPSTGTARAVEGSLLGIVPAGEVDAWAGGSYVEVSPDPSLAPMFPAWPTLRPISEIVAEQVPPGHVLWQHQQEAATTSAEPRPSRVVSDPIELRGDMGMFVACSGPSEVVVEIEPPLPSHLLGRGIQPLATSCRGGPYALAGGTSEDWDLDQTVRITVESATDTAWQVIVFDPTAE